LTGFRFTPRAIQEFSTSEAVFERVSPIDITDVLEVSEKVKQMDIVNHADGKVLFIKAMKAVHLPDTLRFLELAANRFQLALGLFWRKKSYL
jgi:hypothetical protein